MKIFRYFGRKRLENQNEKWVKDSELLVTAGYSYWTLGYVITLEGARKLLGKSIYIFFSFAYTSLKFEI